MAKINRYRLEYGYGSLVKEMKRTLEPVSDSDYIKVSDLKAVIKEEKRAIRNECAAFGVSKDEFQLAMKQFDKLLAAIGEE